MGGWSVPLIIIIILGGMKMSDEEIEASVDNTVGSVIMRCASCGTPEVDDIKLRKCTACYLVKYCSIKCQKDHRKQHKRDCKKRAAELRDEFLFKQPESSHLGDCPICCVPLSLDPLKSIMLSCCSKLLCNGCEHTNMLRFHAASSPVRASSHPSCPFCREPVPVTEGELIEQRMKRIEVNDPIAIHQEGTERYCRGDYSGGFDYLSRAAKLGVIDAHFRLSVMYDRGQGVEKDNGKKIHHAEKAAIGGHPRARFVLGCEEWNNGSYERAVKHFIIAATQGEDFAIKELMNAFRKGKVSKECLASVLRAHKDTVDATKSPQRKEAEEFDHTYYFGGG